MGMRVQHCSARCAALTSDDGVGDHDVVAGRNMHHLIGSCHDLLVCAASEVLGALDHVGDVEVVVQDVDVFVRLEAGDGSHREPQGEERMQSECQ